MNKKLLSIAVGVIILGVGAYALIGSHAPTGSGPQAAAFDPLNATYSVNGQDVTLVNGRAETPAAPGSASKVATMAFGTPVSGDLNGDGVPDAALMLVQSSGGSGTFYYAVAAVNTGGAAAGTNALLLGDRVAPQTIEIKNGEVIANYADRAPGEPMTTKPSVGVSKYFIVDGTVLKAAPPVANPGGRCGGNMTTAPACPKGYKCAPEPGSHLPFGDVGGICVKI